MASLATGMVMPVVSGPVVRMNAGKRNPKGKPTMKEGKNFLEQLVEWTQRKSMYETDEVLKKTEGNEKKGAAANPETK